MMKSFGMSDVTVERELPFRRSDQSLTLPGAANRHRSEESTQ